MPSTHKVWLDRPAGRPEFTAATAFRNGSLQGAYLMLIARAIGLDCRPMSGFLCDLGHGDAGKVAPRGPRLAFDEACRVV